MIIGVVYTLSLTHFEKIEEPKERLSLSNLREFLQAIEHESKVELLCFRECESCYIYVDGEHKSEYDSRLDSFLSEEVHSYYYSYKNGFETLHEQVHFTDERNYENICFSYKVNAQGDARNIYVAYNNKVYAPSLHFSQREFETLDAVENHLQSLRMKFH